VWLFLPPFSHTPKHSTNDELTHKQFEMVWPWPFFCDAPTITTLY